MEDREKADRVGLLLQHYVPGLPMTTSDLTKIGIGSDSLTRFVQKGYLKRVGRGAYCLPNDNITDAGAAAVLLRENPGVHVGGRVALMWQGIRHNISFRYVIGLYGTERLQFPPWAKSFDLTYQRLNGFFDFSDEEGRELDRDTLSVPITAPFNLTCSEPERAFLEYLNDVCQHQDGTIEEAINLGDSLMYPRIKVLGPLLHRCQSVQVKRLFVKVARRASFLGFDLADFIDEYQVYLGSAPLSVKPIDRDFEEF